MAKPSVSVPDELLEEFDEKLWKLKVDGEIPRDTDRSEVIRDLMRQWVEGNLRTTSKETAKVEASD